MGKFRLMLAIVAGKLSALLSKRLGWQGSALPGMLALAIYPVVLRELARQAREGVIVVTGTNGKTTTTNMLAHILQKAGMLVVYNQEGANLITGVTTALIHKASIFGKTNFDWAVLEVDEANIPLVAEQIELDHLVVTNFFRDQLDRYGELDTTVNIIGDSIREKLAGTTLILNADDPLVAQFGATAHKAIYYGLGPRQHPDIHRYNTREARLCPLCNATLSYAYYHYSQLGLYHCPSCSFRRPEPEVEGLVINTAKERIISQVKFNSAKYALELNTQGLYNLYNALAAFTAAVAAGIKPDQIVENLRSYEPVIGRLEAFRYKDKVLYLNLVKNPAGFNEALNLLSTHNEPKDVLISLNDNVADGRDLSWIWDVDFEVLEVLQEDIGIFLCSGLRAEEAALRLKYAGIKPEKICLETNIEAAASRALEGIGSKVFLFANYTALWPLEKQLRRQAFIGEEVE